VSVLQGGPHGELLLRGARLGAERLTAMLDHVLKSNLRREETGERGMPVCIWGLHGVGKTALVREYADRRGWRFAYCAPAQFEEMGDLHGLPRHETQADGRVVTSYAPPSWVPREEGPGILLLDDVNRADDRILRGLMQLFQRGGLLSWALPPRWQIVCTANPEGGEYSVTPMDDAMLTRLLHATMVFDAKEWAVWAHRRGVDPRGIAFTLTYPELIAGGRTTARSLTEFFEQLRGIEDLTAHRETVRVLALSSLDEVTAATFMTFAQDGLAELVGPEALLDHADPGPALDRVTALARGDGDARRSDRLATICTRVFLHLTADGYVPQAHHEANLVRFLLHPVLPNDLRLGLHRDLVARSGPDVKRMLRSRELAELVLAGV